MTFFSEVENNLLMSFRMLLTPQDAQQLWPLTTQKPRSRHLRMASQAKRNHQLWIVIAWHPVVYR